VNVQVNQSTQQPQASTDAHGRGDAVPSIQNPADAQRDHHVEELVFSMRAAERSRDGYRELLMLALTQLHDLLVANRALKEKVRYSLDRMHRSPLDANRRDVA
jgi:hypothetical protein